MAQRLSPGWMRYRVPCSTAGSTRARGGSTGGALTMAGACGWARGSAGRSGWYSGGSSSRVYLAQQLAARQAELDDEVQVRLVHRCGGAHADPLAAPVERRHEAQRRGSRAARLRRGQTRRSVPGALDVIGTQSARVNQLDVSCERLGQRRMQTDLAQPDGAGQGRVAGGEQEQGPNGKTKGRHKHSGCQQGCGRRCRARQPGRAGLMAIRRPAAGAAIIMARMMAFC